MNFLSSPLKTGFFAILILISLLLYSNIAIVTAFTLSPCPVEYQDEITQLSINKMQCHSNYGDDSPSCAGYDVEIERKACSLAAAGYCYPCDPQKCSKYGIQCSNTVRPPSPPTPPPPDSGFPWIVIIGGLAVLGAGVLVGSKLLTSKKQPKSSTEHIKENKPEKKEREKEKDTSITYILQLSANTLHPSPGNPAYLTVTVWRKEGDRPPVQDSGAKISIISAEKSGVSIVPGSGNSPLRAEISITSEASSSPVTLSVSATAGGTTTKTEVTVNFEPTLQIGFE